MQTKGHTIEREVLSELGLAGPKFWSRSGIGILLLVLSAFVTLAAAVLYVTWNAWEPVLKIAGPITAVIAAVLAYLQWRDGRHEVSFDKYYDRLAAVNERFNAHRLHSLESDENGKSSHLRTMFIFAELDILEYTLGKRKLGYVRPELAERAIRHFRSRCADPRDSEFCKDVLNWIGKADAEGSARGYEASTCDAVRLIGQECRPGNGVRP